jgi:hypothetical protein
VASKRHFNRVEFEGLDPNYLEDGLSEMEAKLAPFLVDVIAEKRFPTYEHFNWIMNLAAHLSVRNPRMRGQMDVFIKTSQDAWPAYRYQAKRSGIADKFRGESWSQSKALKSLMKK